MLRIVDGSILFAVARGDCNVIRMLSLTRFREVAVPEPVVLYTGTEVRGLSQFEAVERWSRLVATMPRLPWTADVTEELLDLELPSGLPVNLDAIVVAHALAEKAAVLTREPGRYTWARRLKLDAMPV
jgi:hypothetical protein